MNHHYIDLDRHFRDLTRQEQESPELITSLNDTKFGSTWDKLLNSKRVLILAEAGSGKTSEMKARKKRLTYQGHFAFFIPIERLEKEGVHDYLSLESNEAKNFDAWLTASNPPAYFFLDAVDELKLTGGKLDICLGKVARALGSACNRAHIFVSCRPTDWRPLYDLAIFYEKLPINDSLSTSELTSEEEFLAPLRSSKKSKKETPPVEEFRCVILQPLKSRSNRNICVCQRCHELQSVNSRNK